LGKVILGFIIGFIIAGFVALITAAQIVSSNKVSFCASCHEMKVFHETWTKAAHGTIHRGTIRAKCADCHLPHEGFMKYLFAKISYGMSDYYAHITGKKASIDQWIEELEKRKSKVSHAYESGCKECHKELIGNGIPIKAITAHKAYLIGETDKTCVSCHSNVGHGDVLAALLEKKQKR